MSEDRFVEVKDVGIFGGGTRRSIGSSYIAVGQESSSPSLLASGLDSTTKDYGGMGPMYTLLAPPFPILLILIISIEI